MQSGPSAACAGSAAGGPGEITAPWGAGAPLARVRAHRGDSESRAGRRREGVDAKVRRRCGGERRQKPAAARVSSLEEVTKAGAGKGFGAAAREAGPSGREQGDGRPGRDGVSVLERVGIIVIGDGGTATERVTEGGGR